MKLYNIDMNLIDKQYIEILSLSNFELNKLRFIDNSDDNKSLTLINLTKNYL